MTPTSLVLSYCAERGAVGGARRVKGWRRLAIQATEESDRCHVRVLEAIAGWSRLACLTSSVAPMVNHRQLQVVREAVGPSHVAVLRGLRASESLGQQDGKPMLARERVRPCGDLVAIRGARAKAGQAHVRVRPLGATRGADKVKDPAALLRDHALHGSMVHNFGGALKRLRAQEREQLPVPIRGCAGGRRER